MDRRIRFHSAPDLEFSGNPQFREATVVAYRHGVENESDPERRLGRVVSYLKNGREMRFRVYRHDGACVADCGQFGNTFSVLRGLQEN